MGKFVLNTTETLATYQDSVVTPIEDSYERLFKTLIHAFTFVRLEYPVPLRSERIIDLFEEITKEVRKIKEMKTG